MRVLLRIAGLAVLIGVVAGNAPTAMARPGPEVVRYRGYAVRLPAGWPVYNLRLHPETCARFDRHALYLGPPSASQRCPAHAVGRTEAILVAPLAAGSAQVGRSVVPIGQLSIVRRGLVITATWDRRPRVIEQALGLRSLPRARASSSSAVRAVAAPRARTASSVAKGLGFDACSAPSAAAMSAWAGGPYRSVGIYIGGANMGCSQPNLTAAWTKQQSNAGWHLIPTYVGLQSPTSSCGCATISSRNATSEGTAAAADAVDQARALGIGTGNPIYFDMEAYSSGGATSTVLAFLSAWTAGLHSDGYLSGVYSSGRSGIRDLADAMGTGFKEPDDIWIADWNGSQTTSDPYVPGSDWASDQRIHQYLGAHNATYGGVTINIDSNYLDGATAGARVLIPDGTFVEVPGYPPIYRVAGGAPLWVSAWVFGPPQPVSMITPQQFASLNAVPANGTFLTTTTGAVYRVAGGVPFAIGNWSLFAGVQPSVVVDPWDLSNLASPLSHLRAVPADGTVIEGLPSGSYWSFRQGERRPVAASPAAVAIDDADLAPYAIAPAPTPVRCVVPSLRRLTLSGARRALRHAHCRLGKVHSPHRTPAGHIARVVSQSPRAKTAHAAGSAVRVTLK
jgi:Domain of unknown function (DUF1906)